MLLFIPFFYPLLSIHSGLYAQRGVEPEPVSHVEFDPFEEILWSATEGAFYFSSRALSAGPFKKVSGLDIPLH